MTDAMLVSEEGEERVVDYQEGVWEHPCGSQLFFMHDDGTVQCSRCSEFLPALRWTRTGQVA